MPVTVEIVDGSADLTTYKKIFDYFRWVDREFSPFKTLSEVSKINRGVIEAREYSAEVNEILDLAEETKRLTKGYFNVWHKGKFDPSGIVKGWAIKKAAEILLKEKYQDFYVEAGGDIQTKGCKIQDTRYKNRKWKVGIRSPFKFTEIVKVVGLSGEGIATSGTYLRGQHVYDPFTNMPIEDIVSLSVIGPNVYEADRFATAAFAMGKKGINFIEEMPELEGYMINNKGIATMTSGFGQYVLNT